LEFRDTPKQLELVDLQVSHAKHIMAYGGSRSGKTFRHIKSIIIRASKARSRHCILRHTFNSAKTSIFFDTLPKVLRLAFPDLKYEENRTDWFITLPNGSELWVAGLDDDKRVEKILGKEFSTLYFNECSQISYKAIQVALTRLAEKNELLKKVYYDQNPPSKKHWSYWLFVKGLDPIDNVPVNKNDYAALLMNPSDNMENIDKDYISEILDKMPEAQRKRFRDGEFSSDDDGQAYYTFDREKHTTTISKSYRQGQVCIGMDFNVNPMTAVVGHFINNKFYVFTERFLPNSDTYKMSHSLISGGFKGGNIYPDSTGKNRKTSGISDHTILKEAGFTVVPTFNPLVVDRVNNVNRLLREDRLIIDKSCGKLIADLEKVSWKDGVLDQKTDTMLTHISDALGYWCWALDPLRPEQEKSSTTIL